MAPSLRPLPANPPRHSNRPIRLSRAQVKTYRVDSSDSDELEGHDGGLNDAEPSVRRRPLIYPEFCPSENSQSEKHSPRSKKSSGARITRSSSNRKKRSLFVHAARKAWTTSPKQLKPEDKGDFEMPAPMETANIPLWQTLPYHVLLPIFMEAAPMGAGISPTELWKSVRWLLGVSRLCRPFFEPAIAALYYSPPFAVDRLEGLRRLLDSDQNTLSTNYSNKVKCLDNYGYTHNVDGPSLRRLLYVTPLLKHLRIRDSSDTPRKLSKPFLFSFLERWFDWMPPKHIQLRSWEWSARVQLSRLKEFHLHPMFQQLRSLQFYRLWPYEPLETQQQFLDGEMQFSPAQHLAAALAALPNLSTLDFSQCQLPTDLLLVLPVNLRELSLDQCENVDSEGLSSFLFEHGRKMEVLSLTHNKELDMSFTVGLRASCPLLRVFRMDLNFSSGYTLAHDVEPHFDLLLYPGQVPTWPSNLEMLELERLRKWDIATAEAVFKSLIEAAPRLKYLRTLILTAILKTDWRDRAQFREEWVRTLERTFLRRCAPPSSVSNIGLKPSLEESPPGPCENALSTSHLTADSAIEGQVPKRKSRRLAERGSPKESDDSERYMNTGTSPLASSTCRGVQSSPSREPQAPGATEQGMCNMVKIRIDNLRPADTILPAENLSDNEISGDDDWEGDDLEFNDRYAW